MNPNIFTPVTGCISSPTTEQLNIYAYNNAISFLVARYIRQAQQKEQFGKKSQEYYDKINNLYYLLLYITVVNEERQIDINNGITNPCSTYGNKFLCMISYFRCYNIDITPLLAIFNLNCTSVCSGPGGIGFMEISGNSDCIDFIVE